MSPWARWAGRASQLIRISTYGLRSELVLWQMLSKPWQGVGVGEGVLVGVTHAAGAKVSTNPSKRVPPVLHSYWVNGPVVTCFCTPTTASKPPEGSNPYTI